MGEQQDYSSNAVLDLLRPQTTGGKIVTFRPGVDLGAETSLMEGIAGRGVHVLSSLEESVFEVADEYSAILFEDSGVAYIPPGSDPERVAFMAQQLQADERVTEVRPEFYLYPLGSFADTQESTWGIEAVGALASAADGTGISLAILDTGFDFAHLDYAGRVIVSESLVAGETPDDVQGHGTHCAGTAAGGRALRGTGLRYGVAPNCDLHVGKVLNNRGFGRESEIIDGILWAIRSGCAVISMSLGRPVREGEPHEPDYERLGELALARGSLIVAAAGNDSSRRFGHIAPVGSPANSPSFMAVAALDQSLKVAEFSNGAINESLAGGQVDIAAPGVGVLSSVPMPRRYAALRGTSMACPHVAGVAALWAQTDPLLRGQALWDKLVQSARPLHLPKRDVGAGLVQAPPAVLDLVS